ncbi:MAG: substrate-binding domain-containing protein [Lentisphaeria bacterium]
MVQYINEVPIFLKKNGWNVSSFFLNETLEDIRTELKDEDSFFVFYGILGLQTHHFFELITAFGISKRTILLGELGNQFGISSIIADEPLQIRTAMNLLQKAGCEKVGLFEGNIANSVEQQRFATWRNYYPNNEWRDYLFDANLSGSDALAIEKASFFLKKAYQLGRFNKISAMIFPDPRIAGMSVGLFKDLKIKVPETLSIVAIGDANFLTFVRPQITVVDPNMNEHIQTILKILEDKFNGKNELPLLHLCEPKTIERDSIRVPKQG